LWERARATFSRSPIRAAQLSRRRCDQAQPPMVVAVGTPADPRADTDIVAGLK
jgi:hypothetical protein